MDWFYLIKEQSHGPVPDERLEALRRSGVINDETLVWREGLKVWTPLRSVFSATAVAPPAIQQCVECQKFFPQADMIVLSRAWVCSGCKPTILQRMAEGIAPVPRLGQMWRDGNSLVMSPETQFPDRCIRCNAPAENFRLKCQVQYAPSDRFVLSHTRATFMVGLCPEHRKRRKIFLIIGWSIGLGVFGLMLLLSRGFGFFLLIPVIVLSRITGGFVSVRKMKGGVVWVRGVGKPFLAELPQWTGSESGGIVP